MLYLLCMVDEENNVQHMWGFFEDENGKRGNNRDCECIKI